jgi:hypothetical protein
MDLCYGNNEPFINPKWNCQEKQTQKSTFYQRLCHPRLTGYKVLTVQLPGPKATVSPACLSCQSDQAALTTWWQRAWVLSKCVLGG